MSKIVDQVKIRDMHTWLYHALSKEDRCYTTTAAFKIHGKLDVDRLRNSIQRTVDKYDEFKCKMMKDESGNDIFVMTDATELHFTVEQVVGTSYEDSMSKVIEITKKYMKLASVIYDNYMHQFVLFDLQNDEYILLLAFNHMNTDGVSNTIIMTSIVCEYNGIPMKAPNTNYLDFVRKEEEFHLTEEYQKQIAYWKERTKDYQDDYIPKMTGEQKEYKVSPFTMLDTSVLQRIARKNKTSVVTIFLYLFHMALSSAYKRTDCMINTADANRPREYRESIGCYVVVYTSRLKFEPNAYLSEILKQFIQEHKEDCKNATSGTYASDNTHFILTYLNYLSGTKIMFQNAVAEMESQLEQFRIWELFGFAVVETPEEISVNFACDYEAVPEDTRDKIKYYLEEGIRCLDSDDKVWTDFVDSYHK